MDDHRDTVSYFDIDEQMMPGCTVVIVGKRCSGKSVMLFDVLSHMKEWFNYGMAFTPTQSSRKFFSKCMPDMLIDRPSPSDSSILCGQSTKSTTKHVSLVSSRVPLSLCVMIAPLMINLCAAKPCRKYF